MFDCGLDGYAEYRPITVDMTRNGYDVYIFGESPTGAHRDNTRFVFEYYGIKYKIVGNKVMVECGRWIDTEYMWNMTTKANDKRWLSDHVKSCREASERCRGVSKETLERVKIIE